MKKRSKKTLLFRKCSDIIYVLRFCIEYRNYKTIIQGGAVMAKCAVCGKGAHFGNNVSHSHRRSNRMWKSNIKSVKCNVNGTPKKLYVCASCLRSGKVERV